MASRSVYLMKNFSNFACPSYMYALGIFLFAISSGLVFGRRLAARMPAGLYLLPGCGLMLDLAEAMPIVRRLQ